MSQQGDAAAKTASLMVAAKVLEVVVPHSSLCWSGHTWSSVSRTGRVTLGKLERVQRRAARMIRGLEN